MPYNYWGETPNKRKNFKISTKKIEWNRAGGREDGDYKITSKCRECGLRLRWGVRTYEFDHKNNKEWDISQKNCYLVCRNCHGKATVIKKKKIKNALGYPIGHKTIKRKVGYKKPKKTKIKKTRKRKLKTIWDELGW